MAEQNSPEKAKETKKTSTRRKTNTKIKEQWQ